MKELLDENFFKTSKGVCFIRAVKVAAFPGDGRGVALQTQTWEEVIGKNTFRHGGKPFLRAEE